jgi:transcriptional regulator GlxA family with amidase domain
MRYDVSGPTPCIGTGRSTTQAVLQLLNLALRQLDDFEQADRDACARYIAQALRIHEAVNGSGTVARIPTGLAAWQVRVVHEVAMANLDTPLAITKLAAACRLSRGYFTRAFKVTFGISPHRWRLGKRIEQACRMLASSQDPIADIAVACGFNDQAHLTRAFRNILGTTPHAYRRLRADEAMIAETAT